MAKELAYVQRPKGALLNGVLAGETSSRTNDTPLSSLDATTSISAYWMSADTDIDDIADFYVALFAKQGHKNISLACGKDPAQQDLSIEAIAWDGKTGYLLSVSAFQSAPIGDPRPPTKEDPFWVRVFVIGNKNLVHPTDEDPANTCLSYPMERYQRVLYPYGLTPFRAKESWRSIAMPLGSKDRYRTFGPVQVTPRFTPTTIERTTTTTP